MSQIALSTYLTQNRTEEYDYNDLWGKYVLPLNYKSLLHYKKSNHITGGRGIGKTAYIQYHCYQTMLSPNRSKIGEDDLFNIGIYFKPDSALLSDMTITALGNKLWKPIFHSYIGLSLIQELSNFLNFFYHSKHCDDTIRKEIENLYVNQEYLDMLNIDNKEILFKDIFKDLSTQRAKLNNWLCFSSQEPPFILNAKTIINIFVDLIHTINLFSETKFHIFIDEFENLSIEHQRVINSWIKHVDDSTVYHVAYKKHYEPTIEIDGLEFLQERNDYRVIDIEQDLLSNSDLINKDKDFKLICAEIIINNLQMYFGEKFEFLSTFEDNYLSKIEFIKARSEKPYQNEILSTIKKILPTNSLKEISIELIKDKPLQNKVLEQISKAIIDKGCNRYKTEDFIDSDNPENTILNAVLLNRKKLTCRFIHRQFTNDTQKYKHWKDINFLASMIYFYTKFNHKVCSYYGGYDRFILQASFNTRYLLELFHKSVLEMEKEKIFFKSIHNLNIPVNIQAKATKEVSSFEFNRKISSCGKRGLSLKKITERLGKLFALKQLDPAQSLAEITQFSIIYSKKGNVNDASIKVIDELMNEMKLWSIIIEKDNTKLNNKMENNSLKEYRLHPILSSYFQISPRQKRKFEFDIETIKTIFSTKDNQDFDKLYDKLSKEEEKEPDLLDMINES